MEAASSRGIPVVVLDRPNPVNGSSVEGPVRQPKYESFIAHHALPVRHGMTVGELARMFNAERKIGADLTVVPCEGWDRRTYYDATGLLWVNPSPNMRSLNEAVLYPGVGLLEATNLATGRGTDTPFERVGAPWIDAVAFASALNKVGLYPGVRFVPTNFAPRERQYAGETCHGVFITVTDRDRFVPVRLGVAMACVLRELYRDQWKPDGLQKFLADDAAYEAIVDGKTYAEVEATWAGGLSEFLRTREPFLIYH